jgi:hypothetical protein
METMTSPTKRMKAAETTNSQPLSTKQLKHKRQRERQKANKLRGREQRLASKAANSHTGGPSFPLQPSDGPGDTSERRATYEIRSK